MSELNQDNKYTTEDLTEEEIENISKKLHSRIIKLQELRIYKNAWLKLAQCFGEQMKQEELDLMDSILESIKDEDRE